MSIEKEIREAIQDYVDALEIKLDVTGLDSEGEIGITVELSRYGSVISTAHKYIKVAP